MHSPWQEDVELPGYHGPASTHGIGISDLSADRSYQHIAVMS